MSWMQVMAPNRKIFALKRIKLEGADREAAAGFIDEISLLQRLRGRRNIIQLVDAEVNLSSFCFWWGKWPWQPNYYQVQP